MKACSLVKSERVVIIGRTENLSLILKSISFDPKVACDMCTQCENFDKDACLERFRLIGSLMPLFYPKKGLH